MEKVSMLAYHPVKMQCCYERVEQLSLEGLQQRFDVTSPSVFVQRAQILMREVSLAQLTRWFCGESSCTQNSMGKNDY